MDSDCHSQVLGESTLIKTFKLQSFLPSHSLIFSQFVCKRDLLNLKAGL